MTMQREMGGKKKRQRAKKSVCWGVVLVPMTQTSCWGTEGGLLFPCAVLGG